MSMFAHGNSSELALVPRCAIFKSVLSCDAVAECLSADLNISTLSSLSPGHSQLAVTDEF